MQELEHIEVGQQANDGTGDPLRDGMTKVNANFVKVQTGVDAVESTAANATQIAIEGKTTADAAIPATQKGMAGGVAPLDATGMVPAAHLPALADYIPVEEKGAAGGVAPLDSSGKVPAVNLPAAQDSIPLTQKGVAGGVATLDGAGQVPVGQLGGAVKSTEKGAASGVATLDAGGKVPSGQLPPIPSGPPVASIAWWPLRTSIPAGQIPADGQTVSRATFPDLAAMVTGGKVPVVAEADWLADPLKRGSYTVGDGSATIRMPDLNGASSGSAGAVFIRGDGSRAAPTGTVQADQLGPMSYTVSDFNQASNVLLDGTGKAVLTSGALTSSNIRTVNQSGSGGKWIANTGNETRPVNVAGVWTVQAFGAVTNPGSVDAAQLASDCAALSAALQSLNGALDFAIIYPNGGTAAAPASVAVNTRYVLDNPFPGYYVQCSAQLRFTDGWCDVGWYTDSASGNRSAGTRASQLNGGIIVVRTGNTDIYNLAALNGMAAGGTILAPNQSRVLVWKLKGRT